MKDDLESVIHYFNDEAGRCVIEEKVHIDNWGEEMIRRSRNANGDWIQQATRGLRPDKSLWELPVDPDLSRSYPIYKPNSQETFDIEPRFIPDSPISISDKEYEQPL